MRPRGELRQLASNPALLLGVGGLLMLMLIGLFGDALAPYDPNAQHATLPPTDGYQLLFPPTIPDRAHLLGTDPLGRDQLSRLLVGARLTLTILLVVALARLAVGIALGLASGWSGGVADRGMRTIAAGLTAIPQLLLAILAVLVLRPLGLAGYIVALAVVGWPQIAEFVRSEVVRAKQLPFIEAARATGGRDRSLVRRHLLTALAPQLLSLAALETGAVLLLLAELGLIGLFVAGATYYLNDQGQPVLPLRDRAPEWGQMLGGIQFYALQDQLVVLIPALFVVLGVAVFTLLADGLRIASDPYDLRRLHPEWFGAIGKGLALMLLISSVGFTVMSLHPAPLSLEEGRVLAAHTAERTWPGSEFVAAVVRFSSLAHAMERPEKITYYYRAAGRAEVLRISFNDADRLAVEVRPYEMEDGLEVASLRAVPQGAAAAPYQGVIQQADAAGGSQWRLSYASYLVRAVLIWSTMRPAPAYTVSYTTPSGDQQHPFAFCCYDGATGERLAPGQTLQLGYPIPPDCPAVTFTKQTREDLPPFVASTREFSVGTDLNALFEGENPLLLLGIPADQFVISGERPGLAGRAQLLSAQAETAERSIVLIGLPAPGCWTLHLGTRTSISEFTVYAYPYSCRPIPLRALDQRTKDACAAP